MKKEFWLDTARLFCAIGIIVFHYSCHIVYREFLPLYQCANGRWGGILVTVFFLMSGYLLYLNNHKVLDVKNFYVKRWQAIFPSFYIGWMVLHLTTVFRKGNFFYRTESAPWTILLSLFGVDGYAQIHGIKGYYYIGEWFLGVIVMLYLAYPFLIRCLDRYTWWTFWVLFGFWITCMKIYFTGPEIDSFVSLPACLFSFYTGMLCCKKQWQSIRYVQMLAVMSFVIVYFIKLPISSDFAGHILGFSLFVVFYNIRKIYIGDRLRNTVAWLSGLTYQVFLIQHVCIGVFQSKIQVHSDMQSVVLLTMIVIVTFCLAWTLKRITNYVSELYRCLLSGRIFFKREVHE